MSSFPIGEAELVGFFMESSAWGIQLVTYVFCTWTLAHTTRVSRRWLVNPLFLYASALFVIGTADVSCAFYHILEAFVYFRGMGGADEVFDQLSGYVTILRNVWNFLAILVADSALIHRCWVVYSRRWKYVIPSVVVWLGGFACSCAEIYYISTAKESTNLAGAKRAELFLGGFIVCACIMNCYATVLILWRIHVVHRASARYFSAASGSIIISGRLQWPQLSRILVESSLAYALSGIVVLIATFTGSNAIYPTSDFVVQLAGIQFDLIVIRVGRGIAVEHLEAQTSRYENQINLQAMNPSHPIRVYHPDTIQIAITQETGSSADRI